MLLAKNTERGEAKFGAQWAKSAAEAGGRGRSRHHNGWLLPKESSRRGPKVLTSKNPRESGWGSRTQMGT